MTDWAQLPLSRTTVDRAAELRDEDDLVERLVATSSTRVVLVRGASLAVRAATAPGALALDLVPAGEVVAALSAASSELTAPHAPGWLFLGTDEDGAYLALVLPAEPDDDVDISGVVPARAEDLLGRGRRFESLRDAGHLFDARDAGLATTAVGVAAWHVRALRCEHCGEATRPARHGWSRVCTSDGRETFPRTDPAVIMAVVDDDDRLLLGHAATWPEGRFSTLAGFVEAGESVEAAVRREVREETTVVVGDVEYRSSQPWPFPRSLMLGFRAHALTTDVVVDGVEVTGARWFTRDGLAADLASGRVLLPMRSSIARGLIEEWYGGPLADRTE